MVNDYNALQKEINGKIVNDLYHVDDVMEVANFMSKFQRLSSINWKWVRSQNPHASLLLTDEVIKKNGFKLDPNAVIHIFVPYEYEGKRRFLKKIRYDISQTNANLSDFPNHLRDYTTTENKEALLQQLGIKQDELKDYFKNQAETVFANQAHMKTIHIELMSYVVNRYFGIDTSDEFKPAIVSWLASTHSGIDRLKIVDTVHWKTQQLIKKIEKELVFPQAVVEKAGDKSLNDGQTVNTEKEKEPFSFDKLKQDLGLDQLNDEITTPIALENHAYKESQGINNFIHFFDKVEERYPNLITSQSTSRKEFDTKGNMHDVLIWGTYDIGDLQFSLTETDDVIKVHGSGAHVPFDVLDSKLPEVFEDFKKLVLDEIEKLQPKETETHQEKAVEENTLPIQSKGRVDTEEIEQADGINIVQFIEQNGVDLKSVGRGRYHSNTYSSLVVLANKNRFYHNASGISGGPIAFAQKMLGIEHFVDAVKYINQGQFGQANYVEEERKDFVYDSTKETKNFRKAYHYLVNERKIDAGIVNGLYKNGLIRQDVYGSVLFPFMEQGKIVGCSERRTTPSKDFPNQRTQKWSTEARGWNWLNGDPRNIKFFEDPVDTLSYITIHKEKLKTELKDTWFISLHGSATKTNVVNHYMSEALNDHVKSVVKDVLTPFDVSYEYAQKIFDKQGINNESLQEILHTVGVSSGTGKNILEVAGKRIISMSMCTDNDPAGWKIAEGYKKVFDNITSKSNFYHTKYKIEIPEYNKDWNEELMSWASVLDAKKDKQVPEVEVSNDDYKPVHLVNHYNNPIQTMEL